jgi:hypothetical protein
MSLTTAVTQVGYGAAAILVGLAMMAGAGGDTVAGVVLAIIAIVVALFGVSSERVFYSNH